jgi:hypothetical protein
LQGGKAAVCQIKISDAMPAASLKTPSPAVVGVTQDVALRTFSVKDDPEYNVLSECKDG